MTTIDLAWISYWFSQYNKLYFDNVLPMPQFRLSKSKTRLGTMSYKRQCSWLKSKVVDATISLSIYYQQTEQQYQNVLLHEMIHYYILVKGIKDTAAHGVVFRQMMRHFNEKHGFQMSISTKITGIKSTITPKIQQNRLVLALEVVGKGYFVSVVNPKTAPLLHKKISTLCEVSWFEWYKSSNSFFENMPMVRSLRGKKVTKLQFEALLKDMQPTVIASA